MEKYLCFTILNHGNHGKLLFFHSYKCQGIQSKYSFDKILSLNFLFRTFESEQLLHQKESILQRTIKRTHIIKIKLIGKRLKR